MARNVLQVSACVMNAVKLSSAAGGRLASSTSTGAATAAGATLTSTQAAIRFRTPLVPLSAVNAAERLFSASFGVHKDPSRSYALLNNKRNIRNVLFKQLEAGHYAEALGVYTVCKRSSLPLDDDITAAMVYAMSAVKLRPESVLEDLETAGRSPGPHTLAAVAACSAIVGGDLHTALRYVNHMLSQRMEVPTYLRDVLLPFIDQAPNAVGASVRGLTAAELSRCLSTIRDVVNVPMHSVNPKGFQELIRKAMHEQNSARVHALIASMTRNRVVPPADSIKWALRACATTDDADAAINIVQCLRESGWELDAYVSNHYLKLLAQCHRNAEFYKELELRDRSRSRDDHTYGAILHVLHHERRWNDLLTEHEKMRKAKMPLSALSVSQVCTALHAVGRVQESLDMGMAFLEQFAAAPTQIVFAGSLTLSLLTAAKDLRRFDVASRVLDVVAPYRRLNEAQSMLALQTAATVNGKTAATTAMKLFRSLGFVGSDGFELVINLLLGEGQLEQAQELYEWATNHGVSLPSVRAFKTNAMAAKLAGMKLDSDFEERLYDLCSSGVAADAELATTGLLQRMQLWDSAAFSRGARSISSVLSAVQRCSVKKDTVLGLLDALQQAPLELTTELFSQLVDVSIRAQQFDLAVRLMTAAPESHAKIASTPAVGKWVWRTCVSNVQVEQLLGHLEEHLPNDKTARAAVVLQMWTVLQRYPVPSSVQWMDEVATASITMQDVVKCTQVLTAALAAGTPTSQAVTEDAIRFLAHKGQVDAAANWLQLYKSQHGHTPTVLRKQVAAACVTAGRMDQALALLSRM